MRVSVPYGDILEEVEVDDARLMAVVVPAKPKVNAVDERATVAGALEHPVGTPRLRDLARGKKTVAVIVSDHTRPAAGSHRLVPYVLAELERGGVHHSKVTIIIACGVHAPPDPATVREFLGPDVAGRLKVVVHDPDAPDLVDLGPTPTSGIPLTISRPVWEADLRLSLGQVEPHGIYGWSGGAKHILPGVSGRRTIYLHHGRSCELGGLGLIKGNVFRADAEEAARMAKQDFILNVVLDDERRVVGAFAGDLVRAHRAAVDFAAGFKVVKVPRPAQIVIVALGGLPRDTDFWQAEGKGLFHARLVQADGGIMILVAGCKDGLGPPEYRDLLRLPMDQIMELYAGGMRSVALDKSTEIVSVLRRAQVFLVCPGLDPADLPRLPLGFFPNVRAALDEATRQLGPASSVLVIPDGARVAAVVP